MIEATILAVDDNLTNLQLLFDYLEKLGFKTLVASDGEMAILQAERTQPDLILLDVMMPGIDGFETCRRLKANRATQEIPVIFMTARSDTESKVKGFRVGAVDYVAKPFQQEEVLARMTTHITIRNQQKLIEAHNAELQEALAKVKLLSGLLPICAHCKKIRDDEGYWQQVEIYVKDHSEADFSHGFCPDCRQEFYPDLDRKIDERRQDILDVLTKLGWANLEDIAAAVGLPKSNTLNRLQNMVKDGIIKQGEVDGQDSYKLM
ncbi:response regulator [Chloroflexota bacterium]